MFKHMQQWAFGLLFPRNYVYITPLFFGILSGLSLLAAYVAQYGFGLHPCILCLYQRVPFFTTVVLAIIAALFFKKKRCFVVLMTLIALAYAAGTVIAVFHTGVEYGWWQGTDSCGSGIKASSIEELRAIIMNAPAAKCSEAPFYFLGLSMAGWNVLWSAMLMIMASFAAHFAHWRNKHA